MNTIIQTDGGIITTLIGVQGPPGASVTLPIPIADGGTGQTTASAALTALGGAALTGDNAFNLTAVSYTGDGSALQSLNASNITSGTINSARLPSGLGTVTSVAVTTPGVLFTVAGSPITSSGTLALSLVSTSQNYVFAGPTSGSGTPSYRALVAADLPSGGVGSVVGAGLTSSVTNATTTPQTITGFTFSVLANATYVGVADLLVTGAAGGIKVQLLGPSTGSPTVDFFMTGNTTGAAQWLAQQTTGFSTLNATAFATSTATVPVRVGFTIANGTTAGTVSVQFVSAGGANTITVLGSSYLTAVRTA